MQQEINISRLSDESSCSYRSLTAEKGPPLTDMTADHLHYLNIL
jgi:hypothetical protein